MLCNFSSNVSEFFSQLFLLFPAPITSMTAICSAKLPMQFLQFSRQAQHKFSWKAVIKARKDKFSIKTKHLFYYREKGKRVLLFNLLFNQTKRLYSVGSSSVLIAELHDKSFVIFSRQFEREDRGRKTAQKKNFQFLPSMSSKRPNHFYRWQIMHFDIRFCKYLIKEGRKTPGKGWEVIKKLPTLL